jgi:hypothetical protein
MNLLLLRAEILKLWFCNKWKKANIYGKIKKIIDFQTLEDRFYNVVSN